MKRRLKHFNTTELSKKEKIIIIVLAAIIIIPLIACLIGFNIGGEGIDNIALFIVISLILGTISLRFLKNKKVYTPTKALIFEVLGASLLAFVLLGSTYAFINEKTASSEYIEYTAVVTDANFRPRSSEYYVSFDTPDGEEGGDSIYVFTGIVVSEAEDEILLHEGDKITVREYTGGFGSKFYYVKELHEMRKELGLFGLDP
ncbi:MAG: hypothetical protein IJT65_06020 [Eubacterium sp.]|nr:hypothetical protein [Eubacterium sp.]